MGDDELTVNIATGFLLITLLAQEGNLRFLDVKPNSVIVKLH